MEPTRNYFLAHVEATQGHPEGATRHVADGLALNAARAPGARADADLRPILEGVMKDAQSRRRRILEGDS